MSNTCPRPFALMALFFALWLIRMAAYAHIDASASDYFEKRLLSDGWRIAVWVIPPLLWLSWIERRLLGTALFPVAPLSPKRGWLLVAIVIGCLPLLSRAFNGVWIGIPKDAAIAVLIAGTLSTAVVALSEEFLFRGVFLSGLLARKWSFLAANAVTAVFFSLSHWPGWLYGGGVSPGSLAIMSIHMVLYGLLFGGIVRLEGGLRGAILVHFANNIVSGTLFRP
jgi:membrane protease YdiL (CAAX protease family)